MKTIRIVSIIILFIIPILTKGQSMCFKLDSIVCYRIPWQIGTVTNIHYNELINYKKSFPEWGIYGVCKHTESLEYFLNMNLKDTLKILSRDQDICDINARAILILYFENGFNDTIVFNNRFSYYFDKKLYSSNIELHIWLIECFPLKDSNYELLKEKNINEYKSKINLRDYDQQY